MICILILTHSHRREKQEKYSLMNGTYICYVMFLRVVCSLRADAYESTYTTDWCDVLPATTALNGMEKFPTAEGRKVCLAKYGRIPCTVCTVCEMLPTTGWKKTFFLFCRVPSIGWTKCRHRQPMSVTHALRMRTKRQLEYNNIFQSCAFDFSYAIQQLLTLPCISTYFHFSFCICAWVCNGYV